MTDHSPTTTVDISRFVRLQTVHLIASRSISKSVEGLTRVVSGIRSERLEVLSLHCDIYILSKQGVHDSHVITGLEELDGVLVLPQFNSLRHVRLFLRCFQRHPEFYSSHHSHSHSHAPAMKPFRRMCASKTIFPPQKAPDNDMFVFGREAHRRRRSFGADHLPQVSLPNIASKNIYDDNASSSNATQLFGIPVHGYADSSQTPQAVQPYERSHSFQQFPGSSKGAMHDHQMLPQIQQMLRAPPQLQHPGYGARSAFDSQILGKFSKRTNFPSRQLPVETNSLNAANIGASESVPPSRVYEHSAGHAQSLRPLGSVPTLQAQMQSTSAFVSVLPQQTQGSQPGPTLAYLHSREPSSASADCLTQGTQSSEKTSTICRRRRTSNDELTHTSAPAPPMLRSAMSSATARSAERPPPSQWQTVHEPQERSNLPTLPPTCGPVFESVPVSTSAPRPERVRQITGPYMRFPPTLADHLHASVRERMKCVAARGILTVEVEVVGQ